jgi:hypothetical protein
MLRHATAAIPAARDRSTRRGAISVHRYTATIAAMPE